MNKAFAELLGLETSRVIGKNIWELRPRLVGSILYRNIIEAIEKKEVRVVEWKSSYYDKCYETKIFPSDEGVTAIGRYITECKKDEDVLKSSEARFRSLYENTMPVTL